MRLIYFFKGVNLPDSIYVLLGLCVGSLGTLVGAGGGFLLVPILLFLHPELSAAKITGISFLAVVANASSGSIVYILRRQVHWHSARIFTLCSLPGLLLGFLLVQCVL